MEAQAGPVAPARGIVVNSRRPCLSQVGANSHHVPCASSACRTRMPPPPRPWRWWSSGRAARDRSDDDNAGKQYCQCHRLPPSYFFILLLFRYLVPWWCCCVCVCDWWTLANDKFSSSQTPDARLRAAIATPPKFRSPGLHLELLRDPSFKTRIHFYLWPFLVLAHESH